MNAPAQGKTLLIVEDDILSATALQDGLEDAGYYVLELMGRHQDALVAAREGRPDLALVNIELEGRDDGIALARDLKEMGIPVLFVSGQVNRAKSAQSEAIGSLPKPYSPTDMVEAVDYLLRHLAGDETLPRPVRLEVFDQSPADTLPDAA